LLESIIVVNEVVKDLIKEKRSRLIIKVDYEKVYDFVKKDVFGVIFFVSFD